MTSFYGCDKPEKWMWCWSTEQICGQKPPSSLSYSCLSQVACWRKTKQRPLSLLHFRAQRQQTKKAWEINFQINHLLLGFNEMFFIKRFLNGGWLTHHIIFIIIISTFLCYSAAEWWMSAALHNGCYHLHPAMGPYKQRAEWEQLLPNVYDLTAWCIKCHSL